MKHTSKCRCDRKQHGSSNGWLTCAALICSSGVLTVAFPTKIIEFCLMRKGWSTFTEGNGKYAAKLQTHVRGQKESRWAKLIHRGFPMCVIDEHRTLLFTCFRSSWKKLSFHLCLASFPYGSYFKLQAHNFQDQWGNRGWNRPTMDTKVFEKKWKQIFGLHYPYVLQYVQLKQWLNQHI